MGRRSRLSKNFQKKSRNTLILSILGIIIIIYLMFSYGIPLISDASFLFGRVTSTPQTDSENEEKEVFVSAPRLYSLPRATKEENVLIKGSSLSGLEIEIHVNGKRVGATKTDESGEFEYEIALSDGENIIKARALKNGFESEFSSTKYITLSSSGPELTIESPTNNSEIKGGNPIEIKGATDPDTTVLVNGFQAITNSEGKWSYFLTLVNGGNNIVITSTDLAGNETEETISVNYSE